MMENTLILTYNRAVKRLAELEFMASEKYFPLEKETAYNIMCSMIDDLKIGIMAADLYGVPYFDMIEYRGLYDFLMEKLKQF